MNEPARGCWWEMVAAWVLLLTGSGCAQTVLRWRDAQHPPDDGAVARSGPAPAVASACALLRVVADGDPLGGGVLAPVAWAGSCCVNRRGEVAFAARVAGSAQSQGIFVGTTTGIRTVARGCGGDGGSGRRGNCGDPAPGGGTIAGVFLGTPFAPSIDDDGNVLFLADLAGAPTSRALLLWLTVTQTLVRVAGVGDAWPGGGGAIAALGPGVLGNDGTVLFAARRSGASGRGADLLRWRASATTVFAAVGDALPGGGTITALATESLVMLDGTDVPIGPLPTLNDCGVAAYRVLATGAVTPRGILVRSDLTVAATAAWYLRAGDAVPGGGIFTAFEAPLLNGNGDIAVLADFAGPAGLSAGWFVGRPGAFRRALAFHDRVDGGECLGLAVSRAPMTPLADDGSLALWCDLSLQGGAERIVVSGRDGSLRVLVRRGDPTPFGGSFGLLGAWPSRASTGRTVVSARIVGGSVADAHMLAFDCEPVVAAAPCARVGSSVRIDDQWGAGGTFVLAASTATTELAVPPLGTVRIGPVPLWVLTAPTSYPGLAAPFSTLVAIPPDPGLAGASLHFQSLAWRGVETLLTNRASVSIRP